MSIHKSTHHFDLVNWWLDQKPTDVFAFGALNYFVPFPFPTQTIDYIPLFGSKEIIHVINNEGGHGGGDPVHLKDLFGGADPKRGYDILAGAESGADSIAIGEAVWRSAKSGQPVRINELLKK